VSIARDGVRVLVLEHREKLMLTEFEKRVAFALIQFLQPEKILIEFDRLFDVARWVWDSSVREIILPSR
jgi:hypothetical protein